MFCVHIGAFSLANNHCTGTHIHNSARGRRLNILYVPSLLPFSTDLIKSSTPINLFQLIRIFFSLLSLLMNLCSIHIVLFYFSSSVYMCVEGMMMTRKQERSPFQAFNFACACSVSMWSHFNGFFRHLTSIHNKTVLINLDGACKTDVPTALMKCFPF